MTEPMQDLIMIVVVLLLGGIGTVSWWLLRMLFKEAKSCREDWGKALQGCKDGKVPRIEYEHFLSTVTGDMGKIERSVDTLHGRINSIPGDLKIILDNERPHRE